MLPSAHAPNSSAHLASSVENGGNECRASTCASSILLPHPDSSQLKAATKARKERSFPLAKKNRKSDDASWAGDWRLWLVIVLCLALLGVLVHLLLRPRLTKRQHKSPPGDSPTSASTSGGPHLNTSDSPSTTTHVFASSSRSRYEPVIFAEKQAQQEEDDEEDDNLFWRKPIPRKAAISAYPQQPTQAVSSRRSSESWRSSTQPYSVEATRSTSGASLPTKVWGRSSIKTTYGHRITTQPVVSGRLSAQSSAKSPAQPPTPSSMQQGSSRREGPVIVSALLDIGRGSWPSFTRHIDQYLTYLSMLFRLDNYMIIYCDSTVAKFLRQNLTSSDWARLQLVEIAMADLPFYRYRREIQRILDREQEDWHEEWDKSMKHHPEALYADYNILVNSKPHLLYNATQISKFEGNGFFVWVDAGYGHGSSQVIPRGLWTPRLMPGKITVVKVTSSLERVGRYSLDMVYRRKKSVISGGFLAGDAIAATKGDSTTISRFRVFFTKTFFELLDISRVDDDQTTLLMTISNYSSLFNILHGGWFDAFKFLPSQ